MERNFGFIYVIIMFLVVIGGAIAIVTPAINIMNASMDAVTAIVEEETGGTVTSIGGVVLTENDDGSYDSEIIMTEQQREYYEQQHNKAMDGVTSSEVTDDGSTLPPAVDENGSLVLTPEQQLHYLQTDAKEAKKLLAEETARLQREAEEIKKELKEAGKANQGLTSKDIILFVLIIGLLILVVVLVVVLTTRKTHKKIEKLSEDVVDYKDHTMTYPKPDISKGDGEFKITSKR